MKTLRRPSRGGVACTGDYDAFLTRVTVPFLLVVLLLQIVSNTDQAATTIDVVRVVRVDVPPVVQSYDPKVKQPPLLLGCAYALEGGENDAEDGGDVRPSTNATPTAARPGRSPEMAMDAATEEVQRLRGLVVKWYFRRNPAAAADDAMAIINDNEQVYQWLAGGGPEAGGGLGPLSGRAVDVTAETPRADRSALHRVIRVDRPTAELTGEYRCQVEDWNAERRSAWHPMVVYTPERIFKIVVDDNDDDDEDDIAEGSGGIADGNFTTGVPPTSNPPTVRKKWPTEINITCYAAGMHPEPSMSIWVNGMMQDSLIVSVTEDDGDDDESNDGDTNGGNVTTTTTTTTAKPKIAYRNRYRSGGGDDEPHKKYAIRANKVVSLKAAAEEQRGAKQNNRRWRNGVIEVECRLRVPGDGTGGGRWNADRAADRYYGARKSVAYKYRRGQQQSSGDAFAAVSSASSVSEDRERIGDDPADAVREADGGAGAVVRPSAASHLFAVSCFAVAAVLR